MNDDVNNVKPLLLIFPFGLLSHYLRCLMLARHFKTYCKVLFAYDEKFAEFIAGEGFQTFICHSLDAVSVLECVKKFNFSWLNEEDLECVYNDQVRIIRELKPIAVLGDTSPTLKMAAEKAGVTYISLMNGYMSKYYSFNRKISRTHPGYKFANLFPQTIFDLITKKGEALAHYRVHKPFKRIREKHRLSKEMYYLDELEGDVNLICDLVELFPQRESPHNYKVIPPLYYESDREYNEIGNSLDKNKKTIFVSMGSSGDWKKVRFLNHPYFRKYNVITAADTENILSAVNIIKTAFANIRELLPFTDLVICHGGNGTIYQSLFYGIPVLCKTNHFEQEWNVEALERIEAGKSLDQIVSISDYISLVDEWIEKKEKGFYYIYKNKINEEQLKLKSIIQDIALNIFAL